MCDLGMLSFPFQPFAVGSYLTAAYWFTASTSFANVIPAAKKEAGWIRRG